MTIFSHLYNEYYMTLKFGHFCLKHLTHVCIVHIALYYQLLYIIYFVLDIYRDVNLVRYINLIKWHSQTHERVILPFDYVTKIQYAFTMCVCMCIAMFLYERHDRYGR